MEKSFTAYDNALTFSHAFRTLFKIHMEARQVAAVTEYKKKQQYRDFTLAVPALVNGSFACELFLKALLQNEGVDLKELKGRDGHTLNSLFEKLRNKNSELAVNILTITAHCLSVKGHTYNEDALMKDLDTISYLFTEMRYFYEGKTGEKAYHIDFLEAFMAALESMCEVLFGQRPELDT